MSLPTQEDPSSLVPDQTQDETKTCNKKPSWEAKTLTKLGVKNLDDFFYGWFMGTFWVLGAYVLQGMWRINRESKYVCKKASSTKTPSLLWYKTEKKPK